MIQEIKEIQQMLQLKFNLRMEWVDARLEFYNIKMDETMNVVTIEELNRIWLPIIVFDNTESDQRTILDGKAFATIKRMNRGIGSDSTISEDIDIYKGSENTITMSRLYNIEFFCDYDMRWFPFDAQTCFMEMKLGGGTDKLVALIPGQLKYLGPEELTQYYVKNYEIGDAVIEDAKSLSVSITFGRRLLGTILTIYLPTVLLNVIGHATNFFKPFFFEAVVTVNLTGKLQELFPNFLTISYARVDHHVHQRVEQLAENVLRQDDRHLADLQPLAAVHRGLGPHLHGLAQARTKSKSGRKYSQERRRSRDQPPRPTC